MASTQVASTFWLVNHVPTWIPRLSRYKKKSQKFFGHYPYHPCMVYLPIYIWLIFMVNVGKYTIHGSYGLWSGTVCFHWLCRWINLNPPLHGFDSAGTSLPMKHFKGTLLFWRFVGGERCWSLTGQQVVVSNIFYFHPYLGKILILTNIFSDGSKPPTS